jgi:beta-aspartyl-peptidase (threonine type)
MNGKFAIAIHGGAGTLGKETMSPDLRRLYKNELDAALSAGLAILEKGGSSLDAVEAAVTVLEDCSLFNAGKGSVLNYEGGHEMDAAIMEGHTLSAGAVAAVNRVRNPIRLARKVLDKGRQVLLCGEKALDFARSQQLIFEEAEYFHTEERHQEWSRHRQPQPPQDGPPEKYGTVGAVALDNNGHLAAATSTGGLCNKQYGRIGDSCIIGAGTYANDSVAISCTGDGEAFIRTVAAHDIACMVAYGKLPLKEACEKLLIGKVARVGGKGGLIAIHHSGLIEMPFTTEGMYRACRHLNGSIEIEIF